MCAVDDDDFCCRCGKRMPESVANWVIGGNPLHIFCSADCAEHGCNACGGGS